MIYRKTETKPMRNGFNWDRTENTFFQLHIRLGLIVFGLRIRSKKLMQEMEFKGPKYIPYFAIRAYKRGMILNENFDTRTIDYRGKKVSFELIEDIIDQLDQKGNVKWVA